MGNETAEQVARVLHEMGQARIRQALEDGTGEIDRARLNGKAQAYERAAEMVSRVDFEGR